MSDKNAPTGNDSIGRWQLNRTRIVIVLMVVLALATILGATLGGSLTGYEKIKEGASDQVGPS
jgi:hypothetical protein